MEIDIDDNFFCRSFLKRNAASQNKIYRLKSIRLRKNYNVAPSNSEDVAAYNDEENFPESTGDLKVCSIKGLIMAGSEQLSLRLSNLRIRI